MAEVHYLTELTCEHECMYVRSSISCTRALYAKGEMDPILDNKRMASNKGPPRRLESGYVPQMPKLNWLISQKKAPSAFHNRQDLRSECFFFKAVWINGSFEVSLGLWTCLAAPV